MSDYPYPEADLSGVNRYSTDDRKSKVSLTDFAKEGKSGASFKAFLTNLPKFLKANDLLALIDDLKAAKQKGAPIYWMMGGHVIKVGLAPLLRQLIDEGWVQGIFMNSAASIHDSEIARFGQTSEDVAEAIRDGSFGMAKETSAEYWQALKDGYANNLGWGESIASWLSEGEHKYKEHSLLAYCQKMKVPVTAHAGLGTDIIWQHPEMDGAIAGECGARDVRKLIELLKSLEGGVVLNWGSAVIMPEVFLKAFTVARNLGANLKCFSTANFDMMQHYRPRVNILERPTSEGGKKYAFTGHHELMLPLLTQALLDT